MLFNSISYLIFLPVVVGLYWLLPEKRSRQILLLAASYFFYMSWMPIYATLLIALTIANYFLGLAISKYAKYAKSLLMLGVSLNLFALAYFKYTAFFLSGLNDLAGFVKINTFLPKHFEIVLPLAISFFVFEFIHYISDVYKGDKPLKNFVEFALFAAFFPSQIAGPIKRYQDFCLKIRNNAVFSSVSFHAGIALLLQGLFKKVALADNFALIANNGFQNYALLGPFEACLAALAFTFQIYFDFSGYTDMGRGSALLFGIDLPVNFNLPYLAVSVTDFWKRWHISLSLWLRDYLYIPLGGNRCSHWRKNFNLMLTMLLGGLWHGAAWHFVAWGAIHGLGLILNHSYDNVVKKSKALQDMHNTALAQIVCLISTFVFVVITWVFFRAENNLQAWTLLQKIVDFKEYSFETSILQLSLESSILPVAVFLYLIYSLAFTPNVVPRPAQFDKFINRLFQRQSVRTACYVGVFLASIGFCSNNNSAFLYFQF